MKKTHFIYAIMVILMIGVASCTHDPVINEESGTNTEELKWKPTDGLAQFIPSEYKDNIRAEDIAYAERILRNPKEEILSSRGNQIYLAAGSTNKLAAAIASAGNGDIIILEPGDHFESGTIFINKSVNIWGDHANFISSGVAAPADFSHFTAALYISGPGCISTIRGITFKSKEKHPGICIFLENTKDIKIVYNRFENWNTSVAAASSYYCSIIGNYIAPDPTWATGEIPNADGIDIADGGHNQVINNEIVSGFFGIFAGGSQGFDFGNYTHGGFIGQIYCKVPPGSHSVNGYSINTVGSTVRWLAMRNRSENNALTGYMIIDGSHNNLMTQNTTKNNGAYDYYLVGDSHIFGFFTPKAYDNTVEAYSTQRVKDCAENSTIRNGIMVDTSLDPCN